MQDVLTKSMTFVLIIVIGYVLKRVKVLKKEDANEPPLSSRQMK